MAVYGYDFYGKSKYGGGLRLDFVIDPFEAKPLDYSTAFVSWNEPGGGWTAMRIVRNRSGFPVEETDGVVIFEQTSNATPTPQKFTDGDLTGGWAYYSAFLFDPVANDWVRVAVAHTLVPYDYSSDDTLWDLVPSFYKVTRDDRAGISQVLYRINPEIYLGNAEEVDNLYLASFLRVFAWGLDMLRTQVDETLNGHDVSRMHPNRLAMLAEQFGTRLEASVPPKNNRSLVRNLALLYRKRGTIEGIREMIALTTGWDIEVTLGPNLMLSEDQANFENPMAQFWDQGTRYVAGDTVKYGQWYYTALQTAYGLSQVPNTTRTANAYWDPAPYFPDPSESQSLARADTGDIGTWQIVGPTGPISGGTLLGTGTPDPDLPGYIDQAHYLTWRNNTAGTASFTVRNIPHYSTKLATHDRELTIQSAVPVPRATRSWDSTTEYYAGDIVLWNGVPYEAQGYNVNLNPPADAVVWKRLGYDSRIRMSLAFEEHGAFSGTVGGGAPTSVFPYIITFNEVGDMIEEWVLDTTALGNVAYDGFSSTGNVTGKTSDVGAKVWNALNVGTWVQGQGPGVGGWASPTGVGRTYNTLNSTQANGNVGVVFRSVGTRPLGIIFRASDASNFWIAHTTGLFKVVAGAAAANPASGAVSWAPFVAGDRMVVTMNGSTITVSKNGVTVGTATDAFNNTATIHGIEMEA